MTLSRLTSLAGACLLVAAPAIAQTTSTPTAATLSAQGRQFLEHDAQGSAYEKALSQLAVKQAVLPKLKQFAQQDIADHAKLNQQAEQIARRNNVTLPTTPTAVQQTRIDALKSLNGTSFDDAYIRDMKDINSSDKADFAKEAGATQNSQVKAFVQTAQNMDQAHEMTVESIQTAAK